MSSAGACPRQPFGPAAPLHSSKGVCFCSAERSRQEQAKGSHVPPLPQHPLSQPAQNHQLTGVHLPSLSISPQPCLHQGTGAFPPIVFHPSLSPSPRSLTHRPLWGLQPLSITTPGPAEHGLGCWVRSQSPPQAALKQLLTPCLSFPICRALRNAAACLPGPKGGRSVFAITWVGPGSAPGTPRSL